MIKMNLKTSPLLKNEKLNECLIDIETRLNPAINMKWIN